MSKCTIKPQNLVKSVCYISIWTYPKKLVASIWIPDVVPSTYGVVSSMDDITKRSIPKQFCIDDGRL